MPRLFLFDIDNTLLWSGGAGGYAMGLAFRDLFGIEDGFKGVEFSGRTDRYILATALRKHGIDDEYAAVESRFLDVYCDHLPRTLRERQGKLMPGFPQLLEALARSPEARLGLATGNFSPSARLKLAYFGIADYFAGGGFGEESEDRAEVVRRALERLGEGVSPADVLIIGDTPHDITAAHANGVVAVGVATGTNSLEELRASGADLVFEDFSDWESVAATLSGGA